MAKEKPQIRYRKVTAKLNLHVGQKLPDIGNPHDDLIKAEILSTPDIRLSEQATRIAEPDNRIALSDSRIVPADSRIAEPTDEKARSDIRVSAYPDIREPDTPTLSAATQYEYSWKSRAGKVQLNTRISEDLYDEVMEVARLLSVNVKEIVTQALVDIVLKYTGKMLSGYPDSQVSAYPNVALKELSKLEIINLYSQISKKRVGSKDRKLIEKALQTFHPLLVELGLRLGDVQARETGKMVYSFNYCMQPISDHSDWSLSAIADKLAAMR